MMVAYAVAHAVAQLSRHLSWHGRRVLAVSASFPDLRKSIKPRRPHSTIGVFHGTYNHSLKTSTSNPHISGSLVEMAQLHVNHKVSKPSQILLFLDSPIQCSYCLSQEKGANITVRRCINTPSSPKFSTSVAGASASPSLSAMVESPTVR